MNELIITPLGTVSPYPKDNKNCPGFLIEHKNYKVLLDCGEGISSLLNFPKDLNNLIIIISHLHKDHYSGLSGIGYASYVYKNLGYLKDKIKVYIPNEDLTKNKLEDFEYLMNYGDENYLKFICYDSNLNLKHGGMNINFKINPHQLKTFSTKIEVNDLTIVYSSDTGYKNNSLIEFSKDADLLICESTYLKNQNKSSDNHLYAFEAGKIARGANVKKLLLTHFWPEINKENYISEAKEIFKNTEAAIEGKQLILRRNHENYNK